MMYNYPGIWDVKTNLKPLLICAYNLGIYTPHGTASFSNVSPSCLHSTSFNFSYDCYVAKHKHFSLSLISSHLCFKAIGMLQHVSLVESNPWSNIKNYFHGWFFSWVYKCFQGPTYSTAFCIHQCSANIYRYPVYYGSRNTEIMFL